METDDPSAGSKTTGSLGSIGDLSDRRDRRRLYISAQFIGGVCGVLVSKSLLGAIIAHPSVSYVTTVPGPAGAGGAFMAEAAIACGMMLMVLFVTNTPKLARFTGLFAGALVFLYITLEAPLSGMSINPARTAASALPSGIWTAAWIYFTAPVLGMKVTEA